MIVVADTSPLNYLLLIGEENLLKKMKKQVKLIKSQFYPKITRNVFGNLMKAK